MEEPIEITHERSQALAVHIELIKSVAIPSIDVEYAKEAAHRMREQAFKQEALAVLNHAFDQTKNELLAKQAEALDHLVKFIECLKATEGIKATIRDNAEVRDKIQGLFM